MKKGKEDLALLKKMREKEIWTDREGWKEEGERDIAKKVERATEDNKKSSWVNITQYRIMLISIKAIYSNE